MLAGFAVLFALVRANRSAAFDIAVTMKVQHYRWPWLARAMRAISWPGFPPQSRIIPPAIALALWLARRPTEAAFTMLSWVPAFLSTLIKLVARRPRPADPQIAVVVAKLEGSSFPSGHTMSYVGVYGFLAYLSYTLVKPARLRRTLVALFGGLVALVGPSRIYEGHHWPTDVLGSYLLGGSYMIGLTALYRRAKAARRS